MTHKYEYLKPSSVKTDARVQRTLDPHHVNGIAKKYDPELFGLGHVSLRSDGFYYCIDGQHRGFAAVQSGNGDVPVLYQVYVGLTLQQEADLFIKLNANKKAAHSLDIFRLSVAAGHPTYIAVEKTLARFGLHVADRRTKGGVASTVAMLHIYNGRISGSVASADASGMPEARLLDGTLHVLTQAYGTSEQDAFDGLMLKGIAATILKHADKIDLDILIKSLSKTMAGDTLRRIRGIASMSGANKVEAAITFFENRYNYGRKSKLLVH